MPAPAKSSQRNARIWARFRPVPVAALAAVIIATSSLLIHFQGPALAAITEPLAAILRHDPASDVH
jgi:hypothetical protein